MTLIVSPGEDVLSTSSDDGDSGCLAGSPDLKEDQSHVTHHDLFLTSKLKRLSLQDVKALQTSTEKEDLEIQRDSTLGKDSKVIVDISDSQSMTNGDHIDNDIDTSKDTKDTHEDTDSSGDKEGHVVIYEIGVPAIPGGGKGDENVDSMSDHPCKLHGPAIMTSPVIQTASQVQCHTADRINDTIPNSKQKSMLTMQFMASSNTSINNNNNLCNDSICKNGGNSSSSEVISDVIETRAAPVLTIVTSRKGSENGKELGENENRLDISAADPNDENDCCENNVTDIACKETIKSDSKEISQVLLENGDSIIKDKQNPFKSLVDESHVFEADMKEKSIKDNSISHQIINDTCPSSSLQNNSQYIPEKYKEKLRNDVDIHRAKEKINRLRHNFLSSLSADDDNDYDQPAFIVLPHHSDHPEQEDWPEEGEIKVKQQEDKSQKRLDLDIKEKCTIEVTKLSEGSECGSHLTNGGDLVQEAGEDEKEDRAEKEEVEGKEEKEEGLLVVSGGEVSSGGCQVIMQTPLNCAFYGKEHLEKRDQQISVSTATAQDSANATPSLDDVPRVNVLPAKEEDHKDDPVSSVEFLVSQASARLMEHEKSGKDETTEAVSGDFTLCERNSNLISGCSSLPETGRVGEGGDEETHGSSLVVNLQSSPPTELPPSLPPSPPPPPSSPQSTGLFSREGSNSPSNYLRAQSATNFVNLMMLQSRKHKRLHRIRLPESGSSTGAADSLSAEVGEEGENFRDSEECQERLQPPQSPSAHPQQHGNQHMRFPPSSTTTSPLASSSAVASGSLDVPCGVTDQLLLCRLHPPFPPPPLDPPSPPNSSKKYVEGHSGHHPLLHQNHHLTSRLLTTKIISGMNDHSGKHVLNNYPQIGQGKLTKTSSLLKRLKEEHLSQNDVQYCDDGLESRSAINSENDSVFDNESCCSENSCLGYLNFDHENFVDSDNEYDIEQKNKLREACKDIARALNTLPSPPIEEGQRPHIVTGSRVIYNDTRPQYRDQQVEAHLSDTDDPLPIDRLAVPMKSCGTSTASDDDRRNSFYDNTCGRNGDSCECGRCDISDVDDISRGHYPPPPPSSSPLLLPPPPTSPPQRVNDKWGKDSSDYEGEDEGFRTDVGEGCRTDEFDVCSTSDDNDYDDYCQTDDCGDDCDYCSGDDAEDEAEDTCYFCKNSQTVTPVCKHPGVITNGILKSFRGRGREGKECSLRGVPHGRSLALQAAIHRRRLTRQGLVAIRESSITSDELPESEEEQSYDGSNCDISSSWRFGLCRDMTMSRDSTLRSVRSDRSSSSLPSEQVRLKHKEKSNSLPGANSRSIAGDIPGRMIHSVGGVGEGSGIGTPFRQVSTSDEESGTLSMGSHNSLPRLPPRPPRAPRMRPPLTPSPPAGGFSIPPASPNSPRPAMGLQGLQQQRSPSAPRALHVSGLPVAPRTVAPRSPSNPNPPYGFPTLVGPGATLLCPGSPNLTGRSTPSPGGGTGTLGSEGPPPASPRTSSRAGALVTRNFSISDDEGGGRWSGGRRHVTITRHESVYKEVAEKGYHLPPGSPVDPYWLTWKLGVLQKTVEEVSGRLDEAQKTAEGWGPVSQDPNLADQHAHNVRKFREGLAELQRGVDDVNDQAARFSAHNVPLTPANSAKLHDLNNRWKSLETAVNDRWRQVACRSREVTPLTPAQLASSVSPPWERATTSNKVPYYINHDQESTHWDHPIMMDLLDSMNEFNHIKFSAYRTATKLRILQKRLALDLAKLQTATDIFDEHGLRGQNDRLIDVGDMVVVLSALYANISADNPEVDTTLAMDLCLNWLLNVYDSQRTGQMRVLSFKIGLVCLCMGHLEEKYRYMFRLIADPNRLVDQRKLGLLLHDCVQVPRQLGEVAAFGGSNIEPSVRSCFTKAGKDRETIEAVHFLTWVQQEPQSLVWLAVLHRVAASENIQHQVKCNICKAYPIIGLRYRCLKCLSFDMCQRCFFDGRSGKSHKITHPMHEYCTATTAGEDVKDFTKALKNKFKSKRSLQKHTKKGYLPVQTVLEGDPLESPSPSPQHNVTSQDMHSRLELYASRLAEVELRTNSNSTPDSEDEHGLIAQYCQSLSSSDAPLPVPRSPLQIMAAVDAEQKDELEQMIRALEEENSVLQAEYDRLRSQQPVGSPPDDGLAGQRSEADMLAEAKLLRQHKGRLEARMGILEEHNRQLEAQLHRLRQLLGEPGGVGSPNKSGTLQTKSVTASQLAMDSPAKLNGHSTQGGATSAYDGLEQMSEYVRPPPPPMGSVAHVGNLFSRAAPYRSSGWRPGEGSWHSGGHNDPRGGERLA